jgi:hypothetical protein
MQPLGGQAWLAVDPATGEIVAEVRALPVQRRARRRGYLLLLVASGVVVP